MTKICTLPFSQMRPYDSSAAPQQLYTPCCQDWLEKDFFQLGWGEDVWNGPAYQEIRRRILKGDYSLCRRGMCQMPIFTLEELKKVGGNVAHSPLNPENLAAMERGETVMPQGPSAISIDGDPRCNLACPSCRDHFFTDLTDHNRETMKNVEENLWKNRLTLRLVDCTGWGEVFHSPWMFGILKSLTRENFPSLETIQFVTNGLLCTPAKFAELGEVADRITRIMVSVDAGNEAVYKKTRGGNWAALNRNLEFLGKRMLEKKLTLFNLNITVRKENFRSLKECLDLGRRHHVTRVAFRTFNRWSTMGIPNYEDEAVHLPGHPDREELISICRELKKDPLSLIAIDGIDV